MASYVKNVYTKNYKKNLVFFFQVSISNVRVVFLAFFVHFNGDFTCFNFSR